MEFMTLMHAMMDFQDATGARFFVEDGRICAQVPTSMENLELFEQGQAMFSA